MIKNLRSETHASAENKKNNESEKLFCIQRVCLICFAEHFGFSLSIYGTPLTPLSSFLVSFGF